LIINQWISGDKIQTNIHSTFISFRMTLTFFKNTKGL